LGHLTRIDTFFCPICVWIRGVLLFILALMCLLQYYSESHGVIYVIDSCDPENLAISAQTFSESHHRHNYVYTILQKKLKG
jgi:hypothetical protein